MRVPTPRAALEARGIHANVGEMKHATDERATKIMWMARCPLHHTLPPNAPVCLPGGMEAANLVHESAMMPSNTPTHHIERGRTRPSQKTTMDIKTRTGIHTSQNNNSRFII